MTQALIGIPLGCLALFTACARRACGDWRQGLLHGFVAWGVTLTLITELLGATDQIRRRNVLALWILAFTGGSWLLRRLQRSQTHRAVNSILEAGRNETPREMIGRDGVLAGISVILLVTLILGVATAPSYADAMAYHLPRVMQWIQNRSLEFYSTNVPRQLYQVPGGDYVQLHFQMLTQGDRLANLPQWLAFAGNIVLLSLVARQLGAGTTGQLLAAVFAATAPNAIAQASGAQVEHLTSMWTTAAISLGLSLRDAVRHHSPRDSSLLLHAALAGAAGGLAVLTKSTAVVFLAPFVIWLGPGIRTGRAMRTAGVWVTMIAVVLALNGPHLVRNTAEFGDPLGAARDWMIAQSFSPAHVISNISRQIASHYWTPWGSANDGLYAAVATLHRFIGVDIDNAATSVNLWGRFGTRLGLFAEFTAGNPLHLAFVLFLPVAYSLRYRTVGRKLLPYSLCVLVGFTVLAAYIRWNTIVPRLHLPVILLAAPAFGYAFERIRLAWVTRATVAAMFAGAAPVLLLNDMRRLVPPEPIWQFSRERQLLVEAPHLLPQYATATNLIRRSGCGRVAFLTAPHAYEYPLWAMLRRPDGSYPDISHIAPDNYLRPVQRSGLMPCAVLRVDHPYPAPQLPLPTFYTRAWSSRDVTLYLRS